MSEISQTDIVVATRFHNVVCALMVNKPVISCGYARKNEVLLDEMGLGGYSQHVEELDIEKLKEQFITLAQNSLQAERRIAEKNLEYVQSLEDQYDLIFVQTSKGNA
jgi:polysaccharide pyruvyl transferase WcaK-like protein